MSRAETNVAMPVPRDLQLLALRSEVPRIGGYEQPLNDDDSCAIRAAFKAAAERWRVAGVDVLEKRAAISVVLTGKKVFVARPVRDALQLCDDAFRDVMAAASARIVLAEVVANGNLPITADLDASFDQIAERMVTALEAVVVGSQALAAAKAQAGTR